MPESDSILEGANCHQVAAATARQAQVPVLTPEAPLHANLWVVILNFNGLADTVRCLEYLQHVPHLPHVVVVDNASREDPGPPLSERFPYVHVRRLSVNAGFAGGCNEGVRYALARGASWILLLNNDTVISPQLIEAFESAIKAHPEYAIFGTLINWLDEPDRRMTDPLRFDPISSTRAAGHFFPPISVSDSEVGELVNVDIVNGCCLLARRDVFEAVGLFDEQFFLQHEESDWCLRAKANGFRLAVINDVLVWHKGSASFDREGKQYLRYYDARNLLLLLRKHAAVHGAGNRVRMWLKYLRYLHRMYASDRHLGRRDAARAVVEGFVDGLTGRFGVRPPRPRVFLPVVEMCVDLWTRAVWRWW
jgi:GT2 family glycosyltransferase